MTQTRPLKGCVVPNQHTDPFVQLTSLHKIFALNDTACHQTVPTRKQLLSKCSHLTSERTAYLLPEKTLVCTLGQSMLTKIPKLDASVAEAHTPIQSNITNYPIQANKTEIQVGALRTRMLLNMSA